MMMMMMMRLSFLLSVLASTTVSIASAAASEDALVVVASSTTLVEESPSTEVRWGCVSFLPNVHISRLDYFVAKQQPLQCHVLRPELLTERDDQPKDNNEGLQLECWTGPRSFRRSHRLELPPHWMVQSDAYDDMNKLIDAGHYRLTLPPDAMGTDGIVRVPERLHNHRRVLQQGTTTTTTTDPDELWKLRSGEQTLLAIRVVAGTEEPEESVEDIRDALFGPPPTLVSQFAENSRGHLKFVPASVYRNQDGSSSSSSSTQQVGVATLQLDHSLVNRTMQGQLMEELLRTTVEQYGGGRALPADHVIFCLPEGALLKGTTNWKAFTYLQEPVSYYQKGRCTRLSVVMHEMGHSMGFRHSGKGENEYGDEQGYMGYAINMVRAPKRGFNPVKHYGSGWFDDVKTHLEIEDLQRGILGRLTAYVDVRTASNPMQDAVAIVKLGDVLYMQYNRGKGYNEGTFEDQRDRVTINYAEQVDDISDLLAALASTESFVYPDYQGTKQNLVVHVCGLEVDENGVDSAVVAIHLISGFDIPSCEGPVTTVWRQPATDIVSEMGGLAIEPPIVGTESPTAAPVFVDTPEVTTVDVVPQVSNPWAQRPPSIDDLPEEETSPEEPAVPLEKEPTEPVEPVVPVAPQEDPADHEPTRPAVVETKKSSKTQQDNQKKPLPVISPLILVVIAAACIAAFAGLCAYYTHKLFIEDKEMKDLSDRLTKSKSKRETTNDRTETDCSDRFEEDGVIEVRIIHSEDSDISYLPEVVW